MHSSKLETTRLPRYDWDRSYDWNYDHAPAPAALEVPVVPGSWNYCGLPIRSPLTIAAGPLLNGRWILYYASLGFDVLTYKTVRSRARPSYPMPNLQPVATAGISGTEMTLTSFPDMRGSWAVSFGMPSKSPDVWRADITATRRDLPQDKILSVSVVATPDPQWTIDDIAEDFARCASWAVESGADCVEANFSCPNVSSADGQLYHHPEAAGHVAMRIGQAIGSVPLLVKIGHVVSEKLAVELLNALDPHADALAMINCIATPVCDEHQRPLFNGERRGIAGTAIRGAVLNQVRLFAELMRQHSIKLQLVGGGGISTAEDVRAHLNGGAHAVQLATAAMLDPLIGIKIRNALSTKA
jgi:dihydroorotate dehydrogenase